MCAAWPMPRPRPAAHRSIVERELLRVVAGEMRGEKRAILQQGFPGA